jgi:hypothetical protein
MSRRSGSANLPLHSGRVPPWLGERMTRLGRVLVEAIVLHHSRKTPAELLEVREATGLDGDGLARTMGFE